MNPVVRVLIVDDSAYVRKCLKEILSLSPFLEVVGSARDGLDALELVQRLSPDVMTVDLNMPRMDGLAFLREQMSRRPVPAIIVSSVEESGEQVLQAFELGALEVVQKPTSLANERVFEIADELIAKIKAAAVARIPIGLASMETTRPGLGASSAMPDSIAKRRSSAEAGPFDVVVLGVSTGGPQALKKLIPKLPADLPVPLAMVIHMPLGYTEFYARSLNEVSQLDVVEAREGEVLRPGLAFLAPAGRHLTFQRLATGEVAVHLDVRPLDTPHRPAVDVLFHSAAMTFGKRVLGIVMTGMGCDGTRGASWIKAEGGTIFTEAEDSCVVYGMPRAVVEAGLSDRVVPLHELAAALMEAV